MKEVKAKNKWTNLLEEALKGRLAKAGNVLLLGDSNASQNQLVSSIQRVGRHGEGSGDKGDAAESKGNLLVDFAYVQASRLREEEWEEIGKLNIFLIESLVDLNLDFLSKDIFSNLMVVVLVDLTRPEEIESKVKDAYAFAEKAVAKALSDTDEETRKSVVASYSKINQRVKRLATQQVGSSEEEKEAPADLAAGIRFPLLVVGTKGESLESINDESLSDFILYTLRSSAVARGGSMAVFSEQSAESAEAIAWVLFAGLLEKWPEKTPKLAFFYPLEADSPENIARDFPTPPVYSFRNNPVNAESVDKRPAVEIKFVADFLADLSRGKFEYFNEENESKNEGRSLYNSSLQENLSRILGQDGARDRLSSVRDRLAANMTGLSR